MRESLGRAAVSALMGALIGALVTAAALAFTVRQELTETRGAVHELGTIVTGINARLVTLEALHLSGAAHARAQP